jgi:hypothetical protein
MKVLQTSGNDDVSFDDAKTSHLINERLSINLPLREKIPADLAEIVDAWTELDEPIKAAMLAMVRATAMGAGTLRGPGGTPAQCKAEQRNRNSS